MEDKIIRALEEGIRVKESLKEMAPRIARAARELIECVEGGGKILICGNGGSAADSQHIAAEMVGRFRRERRAIPALALTVDTSIITSLSNDYSFEVIFARQVEALGLPGDILILISTSGDSLNVLRAARAAREKGIRTIALLGRDGGKIAGAADLSLIVPASETARIQEGQMAVYHIICDLVEEAISGNDDKIKKSE